MKMNMEQWTKELLEAPVKKAIPVLSFPSIQLLDITVRDLISDSVLQAKGMKAVADRTPKAGGSVSLMDLSVEAECFGAPIRVADDEVPTVVGSVLDTEIDEDERMAQAEAMEVPEIGAGRTQIYIDAIAKAVDEITDRPVFAGVIGPFSLAGRLMDVTSSMIYCYDEPDMVHIVLEKATEFIINYINAYKAVGANGVVMAEPLAGLLSPMLAQEFSGDYCKKIVEAVRDENFAFIYHNCGNTANVTLDSILSCGANAYHFGNAVDMAEILSKVPADTICMGNVDPAGEFRNGTPESVRKATLDVMEKCCSHPNFVISSGCDIPPLSSWDNIDAFFAAVDEYYAG
ncbi:uroporphyrinogen decarboxylase family protein [Butyricicoccus porcorum]|uniref:Methyltransferase n=1 Tax=Butyricicoccus porcorum TaxID=1945634 RepID=A0A252F556_9FIRM|nr:uroporphyrinogen decarboxylase family protein [Butyricicoccus porcorum]MCI6926561.1 uroporphyrinogen decarboxylase family protein [Butyricicoccus porcorum]MDY4482844.1 uroporphyrinogen decarboxylase family protein [Butyricicoccus porcorum]OUM20894.1 methyltransferase [Butyricicoccus porcorum]